MELEFLKTLFIIFGVSASVVFFLRKLRVPSIVGFLIAGVFLGPHGFGFIQDIHEVELVAEVRVILLLFTIGLEISLKNLKRTRSAPNPEFIFKPGDVVYLIGKREEVSQAIELLDSPPE